jgi:pSer/pThr/pTyr-binding forkhead associated (FHA) protein
MEATLVLIGPSSGIETIVKLPLPVTIGRAEDMDLRVNDNWVSRRHCRLDEVDGGLILRDLGSKYGTLLNRQPVSESVLSPGDEIVVGLTRLRVDTAYRDG